jgi:hypothetical protein
MYEQLTDRVSSELPADRNEGVTMKIEFLGMDEGCPNTPHLWASLQQAMRQLNWGIPIVRLDLNKLSQNNDLRAGYGSPSILVDGKDLFGAPQPTTFGPACRYYPGDLPGPAEIVAKLKSIAP